MAHVAAHPFLLAFALIAFAWIMRRGGPAIVRLLFERPLVLWVLTGIVAATWASVSGAWRTVDWDAAAYFVLVGFTAFTCLTILWLAYNALRRWTGGRR